jgi:hypothetical protein
MPGSASNIGSEIIARNPAPPEVVASSTVVPIVEEAVSASAAPSTAAPPAQHRPAARAKPPSDRCNPPFVRDAEGNKIYKRECL